MRDWECIYEHGDMVPCKQSLVLNMEAIGHRADNGDMGFEQQGQTCIKDF